MNIEDFNKTNESASHGSVPFVVIICTYINNIYVFLYHQILFNSNLLMKSVMTHETYINVLIIKLLKPKAVKRYKFENF